MGERAGQHARPLPGVASESRPDGASGPGAGGRIRPADGHDSRQDSAPAADQAWPGRGKPRPDAARSREKRRRSAPVTMTEVKYVNCTVRIKSPQETHYLDDFKREADGVLFNDELFRMTLTRLADWVAQN